MRTSKIFPITTERGVRSDRIYLFNLRKKGSTAGNPGTLNLPTRPNGKAGYGNGILALQWEGGSQVYSTKDEHTAQGFRRPSIPLGLQRTDRGERKKGRDEVLLNGGEEGDGEAGKRSVGV